MYADSSETVFRSVCCFFGFILLADEIFLLFGCQISATKLIFTNPSDHGVAVIELLFVDGVLDFGMSLYNTEAIMTVHDYTVPDDKWIDNKPICEDVFFELSKFLGC